MDSWILILTIGFFFQSISSSPPLQHQLEKSFYPDFFIDRLNTNHDFGNKESRSRLPLTVMPNHYKVDLVVVLDPDDDDFLKAPGHVWINVKAIEESKSITLNSYEIEIDHSSVTVLNNKTGSLIPVAGYSNNTSTETYTIDLEQNLVVGDLYIISIEFVARVANNRLDGLYLSKYIDPVTNITNYHAATQFEDISARKAFPCFDEPALKATFEFRLGRKEELHSLWNTPLNSSSNPVADRPGYVWDTYEKTPYKMSTYLVAIVVSDFESDTADPSLFPKSVKTWGPKSMMASSDHGAFSSETAAKLLAFYETYFNHSYDFQKMDSVAVPEFAAGAMENWGLNLYRVAALLYTESEMTQREKWSIGSVLAHELAHQWWGNLVTMSWWSDIWLNEGFANYMQFEAAQAVIPQFDPIQRTSIDSSLNALAFDGGPSAVPVHIDDEVGKPGAPGAIIYDKGSAIIRMMQGFLTESTLIKGLRKYLRIKSFDNAIQDELFEQLTLQAHADGTLSNDLTVKTIMDTWTRQPGFPLIRVSRASDSRIYISQERFRNSKSQATDPRSWYVPINIITKKDPQVTPESLQPKIWITNNITLLSYEINTSEWLLINPNAKSHIRVIYDVYLSSLLKQQLEENHTIFTQLTRAQLIDDYFKSAVGEYISIKSALDLTIYLHNEEELPVWQTTFNNIRKLYEVTIDIDDLRAPFHTYMRDKVESALIKIGPFPVADESPVKTMLRAQLLDWACALGVEICYTTADQYLKDWESDNNKNPITTDYQATMYCGIVYRSEIGFQFLGDIYKMSSNSARQRTLLLNSFACLNDETKLIELITDAVTNSSSMIRETDVASLLQKIAESKIGRNVVMKYLKENVSAIIGSRVGEAGVRSIVTGIRNFYATQESLDELNMFLAENESLFQEESKTAIRTTISSIESNINFLKTHQSGLKEFFESA